MTAVTMHHFSGLSAPFVRSKGTVSGGVFNCYFGDTNFGRKYLNMLPEEIIERSHSFGISRYRVRAEYLPG